MLTIIFLIFIIICGVFIYYFFIAKPSVQKNITWGVTFSQMQAEALKLDWKKTYLAILKDLGVKNIKLHTQWDWIESEKGNYYFDDVDWQVSQAEQSGAKLIYVVGMKTGRWPECHLPDWAETLSKEEQQAELLKYVKEVVLRYKGQKSVIAWQVENEPLFNFGVCPWYDKDFLVKEISLVKSLDPARPIIISDSGEQSFWFEAARIGDIVGTTMYRKVWVHITDKYGFYFEFPMPPISYWLKSRLIEKLFGKRVINVELQAESWVRDVSADISLKEQEQTMDLNQFKKNIDYAKQTGFDEFYFWGTEWWFWLKETQHNPEIWNTARELFQQ